MSIAGKNSVHFTKQDLQDQKVPAIGFKKIQFSHEPTVGDTIINLSSLSLPGSGIPASFTNPSASDLAAAKLLFNQKNLLLISSYKGLLSFDDYEVQSNTTIKLKDATVATEIFMGIIDPIAKTGLQVVDVDPIVVTGELAAGADEFVVGKPFDLNKFPTTQQGSILVFLDGQLLARNVGNQQSAAGDGDYYEVDVGSQVGNSIKVNQTSGSDRSVMVISAGLAFAAPSDSLIAQIEAAMGQIDLMIPTLAALAGVAESTFQAAPNSVDLKAFGDRVTAAESNLAEGGDPANGPVLATTTTAGAVKKSSTVAGYSTTTQGALTSGTFYKVAFDTKEFDDEGIFDNVTNYRLQPTVAGKYRVSFQGAANSDTTDTLRALTISIYKNGARYRESTPVFHTTVAQTDTASGLASHVIDFNGTTDYVEFWIRGYTTSGTWNIVTSSLGTYFSVDKVAE